MTNTSSSFESVSQEHLDAVTGGGIGSVIGGLFGAKGTKIGGIADNLLGLFKGGGLSSLTSLFGGGQKTSSGGDASAPSGSSGTSG